MLTTEMLFTTLENVKWALQLGQQWLRTIMWLFSVWLWSCLHLVLCHDSYMKISEWPGEKREDCDEEGERGDVCGTTRLPSSSYIPSLLLHSSCSSLLPSFLFSSSPASLLAGNAINKWSEMFDQKQIYLPDAPPATISRALRGCLKSEALWGGG